MVVTPMRRPSLTPFVEPHTMQGLFEGLCSCELSSYCINFSSLIYNPEVFTITDHLLCEWHSVR